MKTLITIIILSISLTACGLFAFSEDVISPVQETQTITGVVLENSQQVPVDGNNSLLVETDTGLITVLYMEGGLVPAEMAEQQCNDNTVVAQFAQEIQVGDRVEIYGASHEFYDLEVCSNAEFYITILDNAQSSTETRQVIGYIVDFINECPVDGICAYVIETDDGQEVTVIWVEGDSPNCANNPFGLNNGIDRFAAEGNRIDAFGTVINADTISVCGDDSYYITFIEASIPENDAQASRQVNGEIIEIIGDCAFDGICAYVVETVDSEQITVIWAEGMSPICQNDPFNGIGNNDINLGDTIETLGRVVDESTTSACGDESYYIRKS